MPVVQWMYFDSLECLPEEETEIKEEQYQPINSRYDPQIAVFGHQFQQKIVSSKYFVVSVSTEMKLSRFLTRFLLLCA